jgi:hypothetical protein
MWTGKLGQRRVTGASSEYEQGLGATRAEARARDANVVRGPSTFIRAMTRRTQRGPGWLVAGWRPAFRKGSPGGQLTRGLLLPMVIH